MTEPMRIAVLGPGGVGGVLAALLARRGHEVTVLARPSTAAHLRTRGLELRSATFGDSTESVRAETSLTSPVDAVLVTVKATSLEAALALVPPASLGDAIVVPFLNGVDHVGRLREVYPRHHVAAGTIRIEAERPSPGVAVHRSGFAIAELAAGEADPAAVEQLAAAIGAAGLEVAVRSDEVQMLWSKLSLLAPLALFTTAMAAPFGVPRTERWEDVVAVVHEVAGAAEVRGARIDAERVVGLLRVLPDAMRSSMQKDAEAGLPLELDAIGGAVLRAAAAGGRAAPVTEALMAQISG